MSVLEVRDLSIRFGGLQALLDVNLEVNEYEIVGLIGPNGAGKTTAFNCITGFYQPNTGTVRYRGQDVTTAPPHVKAAMGVGRTFQNVGMVKSATALENLKTAQHAKAGYDAVSGLLGFSNSTRAEKRLQDKADAILDLLGLTDIRDKKVGGQSYGTLKLLELGCALATDPDILLLDEPTSGMGPEESDELGDRLLTLRREFELTMLVIEHHVPLVLRVCDHVYVLNFGRLLAEGKPGVIQTHPEVVAAYLGGEAPEALEQTQETEEDAELDAEFEHAVHGQDGQGHGHDGHDGHGHDGQVGDEDSGVALVTGYDDAGDHVTGDHVTGDHVTGDHVTGYDVTGDDQDAWAADEPVSVPRHRRVGRRRVPVHEYEPATEELEPVTAQIAQPRTPAPPRRRRVVPADTPADASAPPAVPRRRRRVPGEPPGGAAAYRNWGVTRREEDEQR